MNINTLKVKLEHDIEYNKRWDDDYHLGLISAYKDILRFLEFNKNKKLINILRGRDKA